MKKLQTTLFLLIISNLLYGQKIALELHELYPKEIVLKNGIKKVIFNIEDGETTTLTFDERGFLIKEVESKNWHSNDTSEIFHKYKKDLLSDVIHINKSNGDTLCYDKYIYVNGQLDKKIGKTFSSSEVTVFNYNGAGKLKSSKSIMTPMYSTDTLQIEFEEYDDAERLIYLKRIVGGKEDLYSWDYQKDFILHKRKFEIYEKEDIEQIYEFDDNLNITKIIKKVISPNGEQVESITLMKYDENKLFSEMTIDDQQIIRVEYIKK